MRAAVLFLWFSSVLVPTAGRSQTVRPTPILISLPEPEGEHRVGYRRVVVETDLPDDLTANPDDRRRLALEIWYPAKDSSSTRKPYATSFIGAQLAADFPLPAGFESQIRTHSWMEGEPADGSFPVILLSHGLSWPVTLYQSVTENLASDGYIVVGVNHTHGTAIDFGNGDHVDRSAWPRIDDEVQRQQMLARNVGIWVTDLENVIKELGRWKDGGSASPLANSLDLERIGLAGHSYGGTAAARVRSPYVRAVALLEGAVRTESGSMEVQHPLLHLIGGYNRLELEGDAYRPSERNPVYQVVINGTGHTYFSDLIYIYRHYADSAWQRRHRFETEPHRVIQITRDYLSAFFGRYLRGEVDNLLLAPKSYGARVDSPSRGGYPEVDLTITIR